MASCPRCGKSGTTLQQITPTGSNYRLQAVCCSNFGCGAVLGVLDYYNIGAIVKELENKVSGLNGRVGAILDNQHVILGAVKSLG